METATDSHTVSSAPNPESQLALAPAHQDESVQEEEIPRKAASPSMSAPSKSSQPPIPQSAPPIILLAGVVGCTVAAAALAILKIAKGKKDNQAESKAKNSSPSTKNPHPRNSSVPKTSQQLVMRHKVAAPLDLFSTSLLSYVHILAIPEMNFTLLVAGNRKDSQNCSQQGNGIS
jgi:hypothetical protein